MMTNPERVAWVVSSFVKSVIGMALVVAVMETLTLIVGVRVYHIDSSILLVLLLCGALGMLKHALLAKSVLDGRVVALAMLSGEVAPAVVGGVISYGGLLILAQQYQLYVEFSLLALLCSCCVMTLGHLLLLRR